MLFQKTVSHLSGRIERPLCPKCNTQMMLARLTPSREGFELQYFNCPKCNHELTVEVAEVDPLKKAEGWLSGELGHSPIAVSRDREQAAEPHQGPAGSPDSCHR